MPDERREGREVVAVPDAFDFWTDGCLVQDQVSGASSSGFDANLPSVQWDHRRWGIWMISGLMIRVIQSCRVSAVFRDPRSMFKGPSSDLTSWSG